MFHKFFRTFIVLTLLANGFVNMDFANAATAGSGSCASTVNDNTTVTVTDNSASTGFCILTFTSGTNSWTPNVGTTVAEYLIVGGGGGGGTGYDTAGASGGGGGMVLAGTISVSSSTSNSISVGAGGAGGANARANYSGTAGSNSGFATLIAYGGGAGAGCRTNNGAAQVGGAAQVNRTTAPKGGNSGGAGTAGAGGGGAVGAGTNASGTTAGSAGAGFVSTITGSSVTYSAGGAGATTTTFTGASGSANTGTGGGGGGGGNATSGAGGTGASGVVIIKFQVAVKAVTSVPSPPTSVTHTAGNGAITVGWAAPNSLNGKTVTGYQIETSLDGIEWNVATSNQSGTSYTVRGLLGLTNYYVRVAARFNTGLGAYGYPWTLVYSTTNSVRDGNKYITYATGKGLGASDVAYVNRNNTFTRIKYYQAVTYDSLARWAEADFLKSSLSPIATTSSSSFDSISKVQVPAPAGSDSIGNSSNFVIQGNISDMTVTSNSTVSTTGSSVTNGYGFSGRLENWSYNYTVDVPTGLTASGSAVYDDADTPVTGEYGSMQVHNVTSGSVQTVMAWNNHGNTTTADIGFGNYLTSTNTDWTFSNQTQGAKSGFTWSAYVNFPIQTLTRAQSALTITTTSATQGTSLTLATTGGSGSGAVTYAVTTAGTAGCSVSGTTLSFTAGGTCTVTATKAADVNYDSATSSATTITVSIVVTYNSQGGSSISSGTTTVGGSISTSPGSPTKNGYSFAGWFTASSGGTAITFPYIHGQSSSFTLYAQWTSCGSAVVQTSLLMHLDAANSCSTTGSTTAWNDISTNGNNATLLNSPTYEGTLRGKYYSFSNTSVATNLTTGKYATLPSGFSDFTSGISISFFAKFNSSSTSNETIFSLGSSAGTVNDEITLYRSGSSEQMSLYFKDYGTSGGWCYSNNFITSGVFAHYVVVWSPTNGCSFYRNGVLKGSAAFSLTPLVVTRSVAYLGRSVEHSSGMTYLNALMGDFAVYNSELSAADVVTNMQAQADAIYTVTYDMNGKTGTAPTDSKKYLTDSVVTISGSTPTTSGFSFQGWTLNAANTGTVYAANGTYTLAGANITFYAKWISNNLTTPSAPTASATSNTLKSITVSWSAISNSSSYTLKLYDSAGSSLLATVTGLTLLSRVITAADYASIADSTSYKVTVTAIGDGVSYSNSTESTKTAVTTNAAPVNPVISLQPVNASVASGGSATFSVTASVADAGTLTYQWQVSTNSGSTWNNVSSGTGGTTNSYSTGTVTYSSNSYQYKVIVANTKNGSTATTTSNAATLTITAGSTSISISLPNGATSASYQSAITITATSSVNGNVNFKLAGTTISGCGSVATTSLTATCSWTPTATGSNALTAVLTPSDTNNFSTSTSATVTVTVGTAVTTTSITIDLGQPEFLVTKNLTATVSVAGTVQFLADGKTIPGCFARPTNGSLQAVCAWRPAVRTSVTIVATLTPTDTSYAISTSAPTTAVVKPRSGARS